jgi:hypothetical protein
VQERDGIGTFRESTPVQVTLALTAASSRVHKPCKAEAVFNGFGPEQKLLKQFFVYRVAHTGLTPSVNAEWPVYCAISLIGDR